MVKYPANTIGLGKVYWLMSQEDKQHVFLVLTQTTPQNKLANLSQVGGDCEGRDGLYQRIPSGTDWTWSKVET